LAATILCKECTRKKGLNHSKTKDCCHPDETLHQQTSLEERNKHTEADPTQRFSNRVLDYKKYRPLYPSSICDVLESVAGLTAGSTVVDIGSGTGIMSKILLDYGCKVYAVEPNAAMQKEAEDDLNGYHLFHSVDGAAEDTKLPERTANLIIAATAFHWFDKLKARNEFKRIAKPGAFTALVWNERLTDVDPFHQDYEALLVKHGTDYQKVDFRRTNHTGVISDFFLPAVMEVWSLDYQEQLNLETCKGRLSSLSYVPSRDDEGFVPMMKDFDAIFDMHQQDGIITMKYQTKICIAQICGVNV
jgi:ubiquinone/menaquinone biosynthesis C-methylase UbiE